jgi:hypothetical protein
MQKPSEEKEFSEMDSMVNLLSPEKIAEMDEQTFLEQIQPRFWCIGKKSMWFWKCNAIRAIANSNDAKYHGLIKQACEESDENVRTMANWACNKLNIQSGRISHEKEQGSGTDKGQRCDPLLNHAKSWSPVSPYLF